MLEDTLFMMNLKISIVKPGMKLAVIFINKDIKGRMKEDIVFVEKPKSLTSNVLLKQFLFDLW